MADQDTPPSRAATPARAPSRAETRMAAVAKLKRAASLPRMKDGRRPPMHVEAVSEGEKPPGEQTPSHSTASNTPEPPPLPTSTTPPREDEPPVEGNGDVELPLEPEVDDLTPVAQTSEGLAGEPEGDGEAEAEPESDPDEGGPSAPTASTKKRRTRSRTRSRASKDLKARLRASQQAMQAPLTGDSSPEPPMMQPSFAPPGAVLSPIPHLLFLQPPNQFLRPGTPGMYPGTNPPTPLPTLEDIQQGLMRSNSAGAAAAGRRAAMHKLTGGTESYDPVPVPTSPLIAKLSRNNTVAGGERIAARRNMMNLLGTRVNKEAEAEAAASGAEERNATSPTPKRRKRRSRRASSNATATAINVSESDYTSTNPNTPAYSNTGLPAVQDYYDFAELRAQSTTPNQLLSSPLGLAITHNFEDPSPPPLPITVTPPGEEESRGPALGRRRSILIEEPDDDPDDRESPEQQQPYGTPRMGLQQNDDTSRSDGPSSGSTDGVGVPVFLSGRASSRNDVYPSSPFTTPLKEVPGSDEDEERVLYPPSAVRPRTPYANQMDNFDREISWIASPVPEIRMPIHDEDDYDDDDDEPQQDIDVEVNIADYEEPPSATSSTGFDVYDDNTQETFDENSPPASSSSKSVLVESETSPEPVSAYMPASPSSPVPHSSSHAPSVDGSSSPQFFPTRLSVASRMGGESSDWEEKYNTAEVSKRQGASTWEKVMNTLSRAGSSAGRRSRTNSIVARERRDNTDSSISRESGASMASSRTDKGDGQFQAAPLMQTPSASASISSLAPHGVPPRGSVSPIPPPLSSDLAKYQSAKLFPFPGIMKLKEERQAKADAQDDVSTQTSETHSNTPTQTPDMHRERELAQPSEGPVFPVYMGEPSNSGPSSPGYGYINVSPSNQSLNNSTSKLPTTLPGVKQWLSKNSKPKKLFSSGTFDGSISSPTSPGASPSTTSSGKKTFIGDVFGRKTNDVSTDFEEPSPGISPHFGSPNDLAANRSDGSRLRSPAESDISGKGQNLKSRNITPLNLGSNGSYKFPNNNASESAAARFASPTPVASSLSDYPAPSASDSSSTTSSNYSLAYHSQVILDRLDESLTKPSRAAVYADDPPRKLILSSPVLQVVNPNTVKDRFLFLFNDILVIAKPVTHSQDNLMDSYNRMSLPDRKYTVKSVVQLRNLRFFVDRSDTQGRLSSVNVRNPLMHSFVAQFAKEPEHAIGSLFTKANVSESGQIIGQLLFKTLELDRSRLGGYLALRSSKTALKYYLDSFGFAGLRIDVALRVFLQSINLSQHPQFYTAVEHLLDAFASRWYEANAKFVPYDKDMAIRIVWALAQLNERLHGGIADEAGETDHSQRTVSNKEFVDAFRKYDVRGLVSDDLLHEVYKSVYHERLSQARLNVTGHPETSITIKRPLPSTLTYKAQSDPIVFRLPAVDPDLTIELYGQDLIFEPSVLHFQKSSEVSFRVTGTSLGPKTISMLKSGPNAINYSGLPLSHTVNVERSFMRHTFQVAFLNQTGSKRRYMFSVDDPIIRNEWATCIRRHVELSILATQAPSNPSSAFESKLFKASSDIAFKVLQDTLMAKNTDVAPRATDSPVLQKKNGASAPFSGSVRSKSRSRMYHKYGAGKNEEDLQSSLSRDRNDSTPESDPAHTPEYPLDGSLWTARDLEIQCQQNSAIPHILAALQVGLSDRPPS